MLGSQHTESHLIAVKRPFFGTICVVRCRPIRRGRRPGRLVPIPTMQLKTMWVGDRDQALRRSPVKSGPSDVSPQPLGRTRAEDQFGLE
jgi:hypothetical protein